MMVVRERFAIARPEGDALRTVILTKLPDIRFSTTLQRRALVCDTKAYIELQTMHLSKHIPLNGLDNYVNTRGLRFLLWADSFCSTSTASVRRVL